MTTDTLIEGRVTWINIHDPTPDDIQQLAICCPTFHPLNLQDCLTDLEIPKLDHHDEYLFLVVHLPVKDAANQTYVPAEVDIFIRKGLLVTAHRGELPALDNLFIQAQTNAELRARWMGHGASPLLYHILDELVNACYPIVRGLLVELRHVEGHLFQSDFMHLLQDIAVVRRDIIALRHILAPQMDVFRRLARGKWDFIHEELDLYWMNITDHLAQLCATLEESSEVSSGLAETADTLASHRIDEVVRLLTMVTVLTLPLTLLATLFGMNIILPFGSHPLLFYIVLGSGLTFLFGLLVYFWRRKWL